jgi:hypothetical protein
MKPQQEEIEMTAINSHPLRTIVARPSHLTEQLDCGHIINRPLACGEAAMLPSKAARRRCYHCQPEDKRQRPAPVRKSPARTYSIFIAADDDYRVKHGNKVIAHFHTDAEAAAYLRDCLER